MVTTKHTFLIEELDIILVETDKHYEGDLVAYYTTGDENYLVSDKPPKDSTILFKISKYESKNLQAKQ